jgi:hypothetical protein
MPADANGTLDTGNALLFRKGNTYHPSFIIKKQ